MKKLKLFLTAIIAMFVATVGVHAECEATLNGDCKATLQDAITDASSGAESTIVLQTEVITPSILKIENNKNITIDLNNHSITRVSNGVFSVEGGVLTLTGKGTVEITNVINSNPAIQVIDVQGYETKLTIDRDIIVKGGYAIGVFGQRSGETTTNKVTNIQIIVKGTLEGVSYEIDGVPKVGSALSVNGTVGNTANGPIQGFVAPTITIESTAKLTATGAAIYQAGDSDITIDGAYVEGKSGIIVKAGTLTLNNAKVHATGEAKTTLGDVGGYTTTGAAIQVESNKDYAGNVKVNINGGEYISDNGYVFNEYLATDADETNVVDIKITDGTFVANSKDGNALSVSEEFNTKYENDPFIEAGVVFTNNGKPAEDVLVYTNNLGISESGVVGTVHKVEITKPENGKVEANNDAAEDEEVVVKITADKGYEINTITITDKDGKAVIFTSADGGVKFKMPASDVKVTVTFKKSETPVVKPETTETTEKTEEENPKTGDNILMYLGLGLASVAVAAVSVKKLRKTN